MGVLLIVWRIFLIVLQMSRILENAPISRVVVRMLESHRDSAHIPASSVLQERRHMNDYFFFSEENLSSETEICSEEVVRSMLFLELVLQTGISCFVKKAREMKGRQHSRPNPSRISSGKVGMCALDHFFYALHLCME